MSIKKREDIVLNEKKAEEIIHRAREKTVEKPAAQPAKEEGKGQKKGAKEKAPAKKEPKPEPAAPTEKLPIRKAATLNLSYTDYLSFQDACQSRQLIVSDIVSRFMHLWVNDETFRKSFQEKAFFA